MPVNKEELAADLASPEYQEIVKTELAKKDFVIQSKTDHTALLDRVKTDTLEKELPNKLSEKLKETYDRYDKDIEETTGLKRDTNEKTHDYLKRATKARVDELNLSKTKIAELEEAVKKGDPTGVWSKKLADAENTYKAQLAEKDREIVGVRSQSSTLTKKAAVDMAFMEVKKDFKKVLPPLFELGQKAVLDAAISTTAVAEDGKLYMVDAQGAWVKDTGFNRMPFDQYLRDTFKDVIEVKKIAGGAGSGVGNPEPPDPSKITVETFPMNAAIKTKIELMEYMGTQGLKRGSVEYNRIWAKYAAKLT